MKKERDCFCQSSDGHEWNIHTQQEFLIRFKIFSAIEATRQTKTPVDDRKGKLRCATSVHVMKNKKDFMRSPHEGMFLLRMPKRQGGGLFHLLALIRHAVQQACGGSSGAGGQWRVEQTGGQLLCLWTEQPAQHAHRLLCLMI